MTELPDKSDVEPSEFGRGVVVCLAKFSGHLENNWAEQIRISKWWSELPEDKRRAELQSAAQFPRGDAARRQTMIGILPFGETIHLWANGARDHFLELDVDRSPPTLRELADHVLKMGNVYPLHESTWDDWLHVWELWERACVELDQQIGTPDVDWGSW